MAWRLGLPGRPWTHPRPPAAPSEVLELVCVGSRCLGPDGPAPAELAGPLASLARFVNAPLLGVAVCREGGRWLLDDATPLPRLAVHGSPVVEAILACADAGGMAA